MDDEIGYKYGKQGALIINIQVSEAEERAVRRVCGSGDDGDDELAPDSAGHGCPTYGADLIWCCSGNHVISLSCKGGCLPKAATWPELYALMQHSGVRGGPPPKEWIRDDQLMLVA